MSETDDLLVNDGSFFQPEVPEDLVAEESAERALVTGADPFIDDILKRLDARIAFYDSVDSIPDDVQSTPDNFMQQWKVNQLTKRNLIDERDTIRGLKDTYSR